MNGVGVVVWDIVCRVCLFFMCVYVFVWFVCVVSRCYCCQEAQKTGQNHLGHSEPECRRRQLSGDLS